MMVTIQPDDPQGHAPFRQASTDFSVACRAWAAAVCGSVTVMTLLFGYHRCVSGYRVGRSGDAVTWLSAGSGTRTFGSGQARFLTAHRSGMHPLSGGLSQV